MVTCLLCSSPRSIGVLCTAHGVAIASPGITSEQVFSRVQNPTAALIDAWGIAHGLVDGSRIGRDPRVDVAVLHASVSSEHASLKHSGSKWHIVDHSSRNGTEVDGTRGRLIGIDADGNRHRDLDGKILLKLARALRVDVAGKSYVAASAATVFAAILEILISDAPRLALFAIIAVSMLLVVVFGRRSLFVLASLGLGLYWLAGFAGLFGLRLNFMSFAAIPISIPPSG